MASQKNNKSKETFPDKPFHQVRESLFSSRSGFDNYRGLLNDCIICLVLSNSHNILRNFNKYGLLINPFQWFTALFHTWSFPTFVLLFILLIFPLLILLIEKIAVKNVLHEKMIVITQGILLIILILLPIAVVFIYNLEAGGAFAAMSSYLFMWFKLVSYCQVNGWCREKRSLEDNDQVSPPLTDDDDDKKPYYVVYPNNLNLKDLCYFLLAPTLSYQLNFPRTPRIRKVFLIRRALESIFLINVLLALGQQWLLPTIANSVEPFQKMQFPIMLQRILLLALPNHLLWLLGFYLLFHSSINFGAELLRFGDRRFYGDWWNADSIDSFWRCWNVPVHVWAVRHLYGPIIEKGYSKFTAQMAVFLLSALFHEYLVSIPLKMLRPWIFGGMLFQVPLAMLTSLKWMRGQPGNVIVWLSIILGQPIAILMYVHDYYLLNNDTLVYNVTSNI